MLEEHFYGPAPKHILALDGGGVRGIISLAFLERAERLLAERSGRGDAFRLCDHFALIGGTSTGSIIATGLALGHTVEELIGLYLGLSRQLFARPRWLGGVLQAKFSEAPLMEVIADRVGDRTLGSPDLRCGLGIIAKRLDTHSVWVFHNHPRGPYFGRDDRTDLSFTANRDLPLLNLIRASTAAPTYFVPQRITIAPGVEGAFVDGGVSPHNNPSLALFMLATIHGYGFRWPGGRDRLRIVSVGTGAAVPVYSPDLRGSGTAAGLAMTAMRSLMNDCDNLVEIMMQWMGETRTGRRIDSEIGDLSGDRLGADALFGYSRYNVRLNRDWLRDELGREFDERVLRDLSRMDQPRLIEDLLELGRHAADRMVRIEDLVAGPL